MFTGLSVKCRELPCASCDATVLLRTTVRNAAGTTQRVRVTGSFGGRDVALGTANVGSGDFATFSKRITVRHPRLWAPGSPTLYTARFTARVGDTKVAGWRLRTGIRKIAVSADGRLLLNGRVLNVRGVGLHEDDPRVGFAVDNGSGTYEIPFLDRMFIVFWAVVAGMVLISTVGTTRVAKALHVDTQMFRVDGAFAFGSAVVCVIVAAIYGTLW